MGALIKFIAGLVVGVFLTVVVINNSWAAGVIKEIKVQMLPIKYYFDSAQKESSNTIWIGQKPELNSSSAAIMPEETKNVEAYIGLSTQVLKEKFGEPQRQDLGEYGFDWWIYNRDYNNYLQVGVSNDKVVALYTNSPHWSIHEIALGTTRNVVEQNLGLANKTSFSYQNGSFTITQTADDFRERPVKIYNDIAVEFFFDIHDGDKLAGVRIVDLNYFMSMAAGNYNMEWTYLGKQPSFGKPELSDVELEALARTYELQIFDLVNAARAQRGLAILKWDENTAEVARSHSKDMLEHDFFSHTSPNTGDLANRMQKFNIKYRTIAENIAYNYVDAIEAHEGWMNSLGHRKNVLNKDLRNLGVGVEGKYYTQNFISY